MNLIFRLIKSEINMEWDGGLIELPSTALEKEFYNGNDTYWRLNINGVITYGLVKSYKNNIPCVVDELKKVFNITALGTKRIIIGKITRLVYKIKFHIIRDLIFIQEDTSLSDFDLRKTWNNIGPPIERTIYEECKPMIQKFYAFRDLLGLSPNNDSIFKLRSVWKIKNGVFKGDYSPHPITYQDNVIHLIGPKDRGLQMPKTILERWFDNINVSDVICLMTGFNKEGERIHERISFYRNEIERIINRIDRNLIGFSDAICERLMSHYIRATTPEQNEY